MDSDKPKSSAELLAEMQALQEAGDEIRARIKSTMIELEANAAQIRRAIERAKDQDSWRPSRGGPPR